MKNVTILASGGFRIFGIDSSIRIELFFRNPPVAKIVTFSLRQKGCHYFEWAQYIF